MSLRELPQTPKHSLRDLRGIFIVYEMVTQGLHGLFIVYEMISKPSPRWARASMDGANDYSLPGVSPRAIVRRPYRAPHPNVPGSIINDYPEDTGQHGTALPLIIDH